MKERIYLDFNATTPLAPEVAAPQEALGVARTLAAPDGIIVAAGSLFLIGDLQRTLQLEAAA